MLVVIMQYAHILWYIYYDCLLVRPPNKPWFPNTRLILGFKPKMRDTGSKNRG